MKTRVLLILVMLAWGGTVRAAAETNAVTYVFGLSPYLGREVKEDLYRRLLGFILQDAPLNSELRIYDAYQLRSVARIQLPRASAFRSSKTRANQFKAEIHEIREFLAETPETNDADLKQAVRLPQFLDFVDENTRETTRTVMLVIGSPLYHDSKEPSFSMTSGYYPSDGHLTATREQSVYGMREGARQMGNLRIHLAYYGDPWLSELHQDRVRRFWSLYMEKRGGALATFSGDIASAFAGLLHDATPASGYVMEAGRSKLEMQRVTREVAAADWITRDNVRGSSAPPSRAQGPMKIGIRWQGKADLDLYAQARPNGETLFFENPRIAEGYYYKDHRSSPDREYEFVEFESPVDAWQVQARVNFFEGQLSEGARGEVRIEFDGRIYTGEFFIAATRGNEGREGRNQQMHWAELRIPELLKLEGFQAGRRTAP